MGLGDNDAIVLGPQNYTTFVGDINNVKPIHMRKVKEVSVPSSICCDSKAVL